MFVERSFVVAQGVVDGRRDAARAIRTPPFVVVRADLATTLKKSASPTESTLLTTDESQSSTSSTSTRTSSIFATAASASATSSSAAHASTNGANTMSSTIVAIVMAVVFALVLAVASRLHYSWRRREARRKRNSTFIQYQYGLYTDAGPRRVSVVPRDNLPPPIRPPDWDARSAAASSTAATFDSPITASEPTHGRVVPAPAQGQMQSLDEKLRDIFYPAQAPNPPRHLSPSFVPSFSSPSPVSSATVTVATPISPPPAAAHTQLPSFVPQPTTSPQAWTNPPPSPLALYPSSLRTLAAQSTFLSPWSTAERDGFPRTPVYGSSEVAEVNGRPPAYSRH